jgi:lipopolysaccharide biosynthesis regulator YciM
MLQFILTIVAVVLVLALTFSLGWFVGKRRDPRLPHNKLNEAYRYRNEPHADQVTEQPNKLHDNPITRG